jgi:hypothetical protein
MMKLKQLFIYSIFIPLVSVISVNYCHYSDMIQQDVCLIMDTIDVASDLSICESYDIPSNTHFNYIVPIDADLLTLYCLTYKFSTRAPPA